MESFTWHDQRHDFVLQHVMSGTDLYTVIESLGGGILILRPQK
ncbi:hypothetical protein [Coxiella-like endosymbiont of Rhipicephalus sanguineus]|nr:hypothetical protein [Coxiella-like endosymbiont of Rhipicephalus sanguineus]